MRSSPTITNYDKYGPSNQCFEGNTANACVSGSKMCVGNQTEANYVYKITLPGAYFIWDIIIFSEKLLRSEQTVLTRKWVRTRAQA